MDIRIEKKGDEARIYEVTAAAFAPMPYSDGTEPDCVNKLRADGDLTVSLVAEIDDRIMGHIAFSPVFFDGVSNHWYGLGPVSVWPDLQKQGVGKALIKTGLGEIKTLGAKGCVLIGDPGYYQRFGFIADGRITYRDLESKYVQWLAFGDEKPTGNLVYSPGLE